MVSNVFNTSIGKPWDIVEDDITSAQAKQILAGLFEQLLTFDCIYIAVGRQNLQLYFLIKMIGLNSVDKLISDGYIKFMPANAMIFTSTGRQKPNGKIDESVIYGKPPFVAGTWSDEDQDPERNIAKALQVFGETIHADRKRNFTKKAADAYIVANGMEFSTNATELVSNAYLQNNLASNGLPYKKELDQLNLIERGKLINLGHKVMETAVLSAYNLKSFENYESYEICKTNLENIGKAYNVTDNTSEILRLSNLPDLRKIFLEGKMDLMGAMRIREYGTSKYYRNWINDVGESSDSKEVTAEYIKEIQGGDKFFATKTGRYIKNLFLFGLGETLGNILTGVPIIGGSIVATAGNYGLGLLDEFVLGNIIQGKNPSMFIKTIGNEIASPAVYKDNS